MPNPESEISHQSPEESAPVPTREKPEFVLEEEKDWPSYIESRVAALNAAASFDLEKLNQLLIDDPDLNRPELLQFLSRQFETARRENKSLPELSPEMINRFAKLANNQNKNVRRGVAAALHQLGETESALEILQGMANDEDSWVRRGVAAALHQLGETESALEILQGMANDKDSWVRRDVATALGKIRYQSLSAEGRKRITDSLILRQEPVLANPAIEAVYPQETAESPLLKLSDLVSSLQAKYPPLVGLSVLGSLSKGYWIPSSDLDWGLIFTNMKTKDKNALTEDFTREAQERGFKLCVDYSLDASSPANCSPESLEIAFNGLFFGDRERLKELQSKIIEAVNEDKWNQIRQYWSEQLENYSKMIDRFGLSQEKADKIKMLRNFLWQLPSYQEAKKEFAAPSINSG